ncbi:hypothetical protein JTB14_023231 [Gonioctena quinquepunctata]|nr:hypothetical protein JTB14_023231 [Gonioctena quinquepunctata]
MIGAHGISFITGVLYRSPRSNILDFFDCLDNTVSQHLPECDKIVILGDLNIDLLLDNLNASYFQNFLEPYDLIQLVDEPTRIIETSQTLLEVIIISATENAPISEVTNMHNVFDHCAISCKILMKTS